MERKTAKACTNNRSVRALTDSLRCWYNFSVKSRTIPSAAGPNILAPGHRAEGLKSKRRCSNGTAHSQLRNRNGIQHEERRGERQRALVEKFNYPHRRERVPSPTSTPGDSSALAYPINDETVGYYVVDRTSPSNPDFPAELDRIYKITDGVLRSLIVAKDEEEAKEEPEEEAPPLPRPRNRCSRRAVSVRKVYRVC